MNTRGKVKCACFDCGTIRFVHRREFDRVSRPYCYACGGPIDIVSRSGRRKFAEAYSARQAQRERRKSMFPCKRRHSAG